jgi:hypothetical protein
LKGIAPPVQLRLWTKRTAEQNAAAAKNQRKRYAEARLAKESGGEKERAEPRKKKRVRVRGPTHADEDSNSEIEGLVTDAERDGVQEEVVKTRVQLDAELEKKNEIEFVHNFEKKSIGQNFLYDFVDLDSLTKEDGDAKLADFERKIRRAANTKTTTEDV